MHTFFFEERTSWNFKLSKEYDFPNCWATGRKWKYFVSSLKIHIIVNGCYFQRLVQFGAYFMSDNRLHHVQTLNLPYKVSVITHSFRMIGALRPKVIHLEMGDMRSRPWTKTVIICRILESLCPLFCTSTSPPSYQVLVLHTLAIGKMSAGICIKCASFS